MTQDMDLEPGSPLPSYRVWLCGTFRVEQLRMHTYEAVPTPQWGGSNYPRLLLKALLCCPGRRSSREALLDILWPDMDSGQATANLNTATTKLRRFLRPDQNQESLLVTEASASYALAGQEVLWVDSEAAQALLNEAERLGRVTPEALPLLEQAAAYLNRGSFLEGEKGNWFDKTRKNLTETRYRCRLWLSEAYECHRRPGQAETILTALLRDDPLDEDVLCRLMTLLYRHRMTNKALRWYEESQRLFTHENHQFSPATIALAEQIRSGRLEVEL